MWSVGQCSVVGILPPLPVSSLQSEVTESEAEGHRGRSHRVTPHGGAGRKGDGAHVEGESVTVGASWGIGR